MKHEIVKLIIVFFCFGAWGVFAFQASEMLSAMWDAKKVPSVTMSNNSEHSATHFFKLNEDVDFSYIPGRGMYVGPVDWIKVADGVNYTKEQPASGEPGLNDDFGHKRGRVGRVEEPTP